MPRATERIDAPYLVLAMGCEYNSFVSRKWLWMKERLPFFDNSGKS